MRNLLFFLFCFTLLGFSGCADEDKIEPIVMADADSFLGTWNVTSHTTSGNFTEASTSRVHDSRTGTMTETNATFTFAEDGTYTATGTSTFEFSINGVPSEGEVGYDISGSYVFVNGRLLMEGYNTDIGDEFGNLPLTVQEYAPDRLIALKGSSRTIIEDATPGVDMIAELGLSIKLER